MGINKEVSASDMDLFHYLLDHYGEEIKRVIFSYVKNYEVTDDLMQDVFVSVYKNIHQYEGRSNPRTWLYSIAINKCKDHFRKPKQIYLQLVEQLHWRSDTEQMVLKSERQSEVIQEVMKLPVKYREVILLYYYQDFSLKEIAEILVISINTVKTRMSRGKERLKVSLMEGGFSTHDY